MAQAGASLLVDSATITAAGHCQVESWVRMHSPEKEWTVVPACHFAGTEVALGYSYFTHPGSADRWNLGVKRLWRDFDAHPWGIGFALGAEWDGKTSESPHWSAKVPFSMALDPDRRLVLHANFGWSKPHAQPGAVTGGVGIEWAAAKAWTVLAEVAGDHRGDAASQFGVRHARSESTSVDLLVGHRDGLESGPWLTFGLNLAWPH